MWQAPEGHVWHPGCHPELAAQLLADGSGVGIRDRKSVAVPLLPARVERVRRHTQGRLHVYQGFRSGRGDSVFASETCAATCLEDSAKHMAGKFEVKVAVARKRDEGTQEDDSTAGRADSQASAGETSVDRYGEEHTEHAARRWCERARQHEQARHCRGNPFSGQCGANPRWPRATSECTPVSDLAEGDAGCEPTSVEARSQYMAMVARCNLLGCDRPGIQHECGKRSVVLDAESMPE